MNKLNNETHINFRNSNKNKFDMNMMDFSRISPVHSNERNEYLAKTSGGDKRQLNNNDDVKSNVDSAKSDGLDISIRDDAPIAIDDLGIKCSLNFNGLDRADQRSIIK